MFLFSDYQVCSLGSNLKQISIKYCILSECPPQKRLFKCLFCHFWPLREIAWFFSSLYNYYVAYQILLKGVLLHFVLMVYDHIPQ